MKNTHGGEKKEISQAQIAGRLKIITVAVALIGGALFGACAYCLLRSGHFIEFSGITREPALILIAVTAVLCYAALWQFWKVCMEIGRENSFSVENYLSFRIIGLLFLVLAVVWVVFITVCLILFEKVAAFLLLVLAAGTFIWLGVAGLSAILSMLIDKARQIREENDFTV